ncbi:MAG TPA: hypothetical protein DCK98_06860 [Chloroflexi bacterium]|nr:hypothetical protein [Chloroflexota bacterium]HAL25720.1 hypothetical protein [Chloroflexota bacterium]
MAVGAYRGELPDEIELHGVEPLTGAFDDATAQAMLRRAAEIPTVRDRLSKGRSTMIGISRRGEKAKGEDPFYLVVAYDYSADEAVEIRLDEHGQYLSLTNQRYQPPPTQLEIDRAIDLARLDARLVSKVEGLTAMAIPFSGPGNEFADRRVLEVLFGCRSDRVPTYRAWVDLGRESVLLAGKTCECCDEKEVRT